MALLFGKAKSTINEHIKNIYKESELEESQTIKKFGISEFQQDAIKSITSLFEAQELEVYLNDFIFNVSCQSKTIYEELKYSKNYMPKIP